MTTTASAATAWSGLADLVTTAARRPTRTSRGPNGTLIGDVPICTTDDVALALARARSAQRNWAQVPLARRRAVLRRFADLVLAQEVAILDLVQAESGKSRLSAFEELADVVLTAAYYARTGRRHLRPRRHRGPCRC